MGKINIMAIKKLSEMTERGRIYVFVGVIVGLIAMVVGIIVFTTLTDAKDDKKSDPIPTVQPAEPNPDEAPDPNETPYTPTSPEDEQEQAEDDVVKDDEVDAGEDPEADYSSVADLAKKGVQAWCTINAEEEFDARQARMKPFFDPSSSMLEEDIDELFYERQCIYRAATEPELGANGKYTVYVTFNTAWKLEKDDTTASGKLTQYEVEIGDNGILTIK